MIEDYIESLAGKPEYSIIAYSIDETTVIILVSELTQEQSDIPKTMFGRDVIIAVAS